MLLRWFVNLYELEIMEHDAYLKWKEDIRDDYPGKGNALLEVISWNFTSMVLKQGYS
jgi:translation initiation factor 4G